MDNALDIISVAADHPPQAAAALAPVATDALYAAICQRAAVLTPGAVGGADGLMAEIATSELPETTFKALASTIAKATGLDADSIKRRIVKARNASDAEAQVAQGGTSPFAADPTPAASPAPLAPTLDMITRVVRARVHCPIESAHAAVLWIAANWGLFPPSDPDDGADLFPLLHISAPLKRCGKTILLETTQHLVRRPLAAADISEAALYRVIEKHRPTLLIDEFDRLIQKNRELTGLLNSAHTRNGSVIRTVEVQSGGVRSFEPAAFSTFSPIVLAGIGAAPSTIEDRAIRIRLERQPAAAAGGGRRQRVGRRQLQAIRGQLTPHLMAHSDSIGAAMARGVPDSAIPPSLNDRDADNWTPLLAVAALAGDAWPARAYQAAVALCGAVADGDRSAEWAFGQIVAGIDAQRREAVDEYMAWRRAGRKPVTPMPGHPGISQPRLCQFVTSDVLGAWLMAKDDSGFSDLRDLGTVKLKIARALRPFSLRPTQRMVGGQRARGYDVSAIRAVWRRYRP